MSQSKRKIQMMSITAMLIAVGVLIPALAHAPTYVDLPVYAPEA